MEDIVAVEVLTDTGRATYFLTWGRIQDVVDPGPLEALVMGVVSKFKTPGRAVSARVCGSLQEARDAPYFFEYFFEFSRKHTGHVRSYKKWRRKMDERMRAGYEIAGLGPYE